MGRSRPQTTSAVWGAAPASRARLARPGEKSSAAAAGRPLGALNKKLREETQFELIKIQEAWVSPSVVLPMISKEAMTFLVGSAL